MRDFNFFSPYIETKKASNKKYLYAGVIAISVTLVVAGFTGITFYKANHLKKEIVGLKAYLNSKEVIEKRKAVEEKKRKIKVMNKYYTIVEEINVNLDNADVISSNLMENISSTVPTNIAIRSMSLTSEDIQIQGISNSRVSVAEFEHNLKLLDRLKKVYVSTINKESEESSNYIFAIRCAFKDVNNNETN